MTSPIQIGRKSTAASTAFVFERLDGPDGRHLWLDGNQKVTAGNGSYDAPRPNAFSILDRVDCPQKTPTCAKSCYVQNLAAAQPDLHVMYAHNSRTLREILYEGPLARTSWGITLGLWIRDNAPGGFRWHVSGDIISREHARWIRFVSKMAGVPCWIYTRSFVYLDALLDPFFRPKNLTVNLSADRDNYGEARYYAGVHDLRICYLAAAVVDVPTDLRQGDVIFPDYSLRGPGGSHAPSENRAGSALWASLTGAERRLLCPVDLYGKSEGVRCGPCRKCF